MTLTKKKLSAIALAIVATLALLWQVTSLMKSDIGSRNYRTNSMSHQKKPPASSPIHSEPEPVLIAAPVATAKAEAPISKEDAARKAAWLDLIDRYRLAKLQHKLLEEQLAVANAQQQLQKMQQTRLITENEQASATGSYKQGNSIPELVYLDNQNGNWTATLAINHRYQQVDKDTMLPDGTHILDINQRGVVIAVKENRYRIDFTGNTPLATEKKQVKPAETAQIKTVNYPKVTKINVTIPPMPIVSKKELEQQLTSQFPIIIGREFADNQTLKKYSFDETVLLQMPPSSYTIKLRDSKNRDELLKFAKKNHVNKRALCYTNNKKQRLYTLLYGDYLTKTAAEDAFNKLPAALKTEQATIRKLMSIQAELRE